MNIFGPQNTYRIDPISDRPDDQLGEQDRRRRARYQGRSWKEKKEDKLSVDTKVMQTPQKAGKGVYADGACLDKAQEMFEKLTTLEEKVAQLCFYQTDAVYDVDVQNHVELLIQAWQIGGLLFRRGDYRRQGYLIEQFQKMTKTFLLVGNDFLHGLSFYYQDDAIPQVGEKSVQKFSDLGKAVMGFNRQLKVHFQFDQERSSDHITMKEEYLKAFRRGIRQASGLIARAQLPQRALQEYVGVKTLTFCDLTEQEITRDKLLNALKDHYEIFLCGENIQEVIGTITNAIRYGKLREKELDRLVMKVLILKATHLLREGEKSVFRAL